MSRGRRNENRPGYKKTKVGWIPEDWKCVPGKYAFSNSTEKGYDALPVLAITMESGLVHRDSLDRKMPNAIAGDGSLHVRVGDIAYNMMRVWQGAIGLASEEGVISPAYVVLRPKKHVYSLFMFYLFKSVHGLYFIQSYSYGLTGDRLRLYYKDFAIIPLPLPPLPEQKKIAEILSAWDRAIEQVVKLINARQRLKKGLMQQLLTGRMRFPEFGKPAQKKGELPEGWAMKSISSIARVSFSGVDKKTHADEMPVRLCNYMDVYANDYITADLDFMPATASDSEITRFSLQRGDVMITKDSETPDDIGVPAIVTEDLEGVICGYHLALIRSDSAEVDPFFLSKELGSARSKRHFSTHANGATRFGLTTSAVMKTTVHLPTIEEQTRIAAVLSTCDREIELLQRKQEKLKEQKKGLMQKLLTGEVRHPEFLRGEHHEI